MKLRPPKEILEETYIEVDEEEDGGDRQAAKWSSVAPKRGKSWSGEKNASVSADAAEEERFTPSPKLRGTNLKETPVWGAEKNIRKGKRETGFNLSDVTLGLSKDGRRGKPSVSPEKKKYTRDSS